MKTLPARLMLYVMVPAVLGGVAAWGTRPDAGVPAAQSGGEDHGKVTPSADPAGAGKQGRTEPLMDSALTELRRFCERLKDADLPMMMTLLDESQTFADSFRRRSARTLVMEQMARTDPAAAWLLLETWEKGSYRNQFLQAWEAA